MGKRFRDKMLDTRLCAPTGPLTNVCNVATVLENKQSNLLLLGYVSCGILLRYILPFVVMTFFYPTFTYLISLAVPFVTSFPFLSVYIESGAVFYLILSLILGIGYLILTFITVGFEGFTPVILQLLFSFLMFPVFSALVQLLFAVGLILINLFPWELVIAYYTLRERQKYQRVDTLETEEKK